MFWFHKLHNTGDEMSRRRTRMSPLFWAELPITSSRGKASGHDHLVQPHSVIRCSRWNPSQIFRVDEISSRQDSYPEQRKVILECVQAAGVDCGDASWSRLAIQPFPRQDLT
jgi:hypothetical protein